MFTSEFKVTKDNILKYISQEDIFQKFLGIRVVVKQKIRNPLREDKNAGCYFYYNGHKLRFRDPALPLNEDCFGIVMKLNACNFQEALELIAIEFNLKKATKNSFTAISLDRERSNDTKPANITPVFSLNEEGKPLWRKSDLEYWEKYHLTPDTLEELKIFPINGYYISGRLKYTYKPSDICFCYGQYEKGVRRYKLYHPHRTIVKFISNMRELDGYEDLPENGELLVITKSRKDRACLKSFGILSICPQAEGNFISSEILGELNERFGKIVILYDFDKTGVTGANRIRKTIDADVVFLTDGRFYSDDYGAKDFSDFLAKYGKESVIDLIEYAKQELYI